MKQEYLPLFLDFNDITQDLSDEECGRLIRAIIDYANGEDYENRLLGTERIAFRFMKGSIDRNKVISEKRSAAGANKNKEKQTEANESKPEQTETNESKTEQTEAKKKEKDRLQSAFDLFWTAYPKKQAKQDAQKAFNKLAPDESLINQILSALERQKQSPQWQEDSGRFIPHAATWLNGKRWMDEQQPAAQGGCQAPIRKIAAQNYEQRDYSEREKQLRQNFINLADKMDAG